MPRNLILSDNPSICFRIHACNVTLGIDAEFDFATSVFTPATKFSDLPEEPMALDLRRHEDVDLILSRYNRVFSIHCKQLFPSNLTQSIRCYNLHPGYNPDNRGWYPQVFAILHDTIIGATFHEMDDKLDHGNIVARAEVEKHPWDTSKSLYDRVVTREIDLWKQNISDILNDTYQAIPPEHEGEIRTRRDFQELKRLDLNHQGTLQEHLDLLRAMTFEGYDNAYFEDEQGLKIFVSLKINKEND